MRSYSDSKTAVYFWNATIFAFNKYLKAYTYKKKVCF